MTRPANIFKKEEAEVVCLHTVLSTKLLYIMILRYTNCTVSHTQKQNRATIISIPRLRKRLYKPGSTSKYVEVRLPLTASTKPSHVRNPRALMFSSFDLGLNNNNLITYCSFMCLQLISRFKDIFQVKLIIEHTYLDEYHIVRFPY